MGPPADSHMMPFGDHLDELRKRVVYALLGPVPLLVACLVFGPSILEFLIHPVEVQLRAAGLPSKLLATSPTETMVAYLKVALVVAVLGASPWVLYQAWLFVAPGLYGHEKRFAYLLIPMSAALTAAGAVFLYTVLLPVSLKFLIAFSAGLIQTHPGTAALPPEVALPSIPALEGDPPSPAPGQFWVNTKLNELRFAVLEPGAGAPRILGAPLSGGGAILQQYRISEYVNLVFVLGLVFAIAFQLPLVLMLLGWSRLVEPQMLTRHRKIVLFGCVVAAAVLTPTIDPFTMTLLAGPLYGLFELGILLMRFIPASRVAGPVTDGAEGDE